MCAKSLSWLLLWAVPAVAGAVPIDLEALNTSINHKITYANYRGWDFRDLSAGGTGNCAAIAYTKWKVLDRAGYDSRAAIRTCTLSNGAPHAFVVVDGYALDNRWPYYYRATDDGCVGGRVDLNIASLRRWVATHPDHRPLPQVARAALGSGQ